MKAQQEDLQQRLDFIDRTISHAARVCWRDETVPQELRTWVAQMTRRASQARDALRERDAGGVRATLDDLAHLSYRAQNAIHASDGMAYELKSAVILTHIELSALKHQLD